MMDQLLMGKLKSAEWVVGLALASVPHDSPLEGQLLRDFAQAMPGKA